MNFFPAMIFSTGVIRMCPLLERENLSLMEVEGFGFFASAQFQFSQDDRLYAMLLVMDPENIDYYSVYSTLTEKYGNPADLSPQRPTGKTRM